MATSTLAIPTSVEGVSAAWLTQALSRTFEGVEVRRVYIGTVIPGTATKVRLLLDYNDAGHAHRLPPSMWLKAGLEAHSGADELLAVYAGETAFYSDIAPLLSVDLPKVFYAGSEPSSGRSALLIEDLLARNARFGHATRPVDVSMATRVLEQLAALHAAFWNKSELDSFSNLAGGGALLAGGVIEGLFERENWDRCLSLPRGQFMTGALNDLELIKQLMLDMLRHDSENAHCLVHGDAHLGNLYFDPDTGPGYLDWQTVMRGFWAHDVAGFMTTSLTVDDRRKHERDLIGSYVEALAQHGVDLEAEVAWREYSRHALYNLTWVLCRPEWQPEDVCLAGDGRRARPWNPRALVERYSG